LRHGRWQSPVAPTNTATASGARDGSVEQVALAYIKVSGGQQAGITTAGNYNDPCALCTIRHMPSPAGLLRSNRKLPAAVEFYPQAVLDQVQAA